MKIIEGIEPFNRFWMKSCFYHALISGAGAFDAPPDDIVLNEFSRVLPDFRVSESTVVPADKLYRSMGFYVKRINIGRQDQVWKRIERNCPVILGVDGFYLAHRPDTYLTVHAPHFILVYGYDREEEVFYVVEHDYENSFHFEKRTLAADGLIVAADAYRRLICRKKYSSMVLCPCRKRRSVDVRGTLLGNRAALRADLEALIGNLDEVKRLFNAGDAALLTNAEKVSAYFVSLKQKKYILANAEILEGAAKDAISDLVSGYNFLLAFFWKLLARKDVWDIAPKRDQIFRRLDALAEKEKIVYAALGEGESA